MPRRSKLYRLSSFQSSSISVLVSFLPSVSLTSFESFDSWAHPFSFPLAPERVSHGFKSLKDSKAAFVSNPSLLVAQCSERHRVQVVSGQNKCSVWLMRVCVASPLLCVRGRRCFEVLGKLFSDGPLSFRANQRGAKITGFRFSVELSSFFCSKRLVLKRHVTLQNHLIFLTLKLFVDEATSGFVSYSDSLCF
ncbi:hypothetical protein YC2023_011633 [Brassica napus]